MNRYETYCTKEQTMKALALGAPIILESEYYTPTENDIKLDDPIPCDSYTCGYHYAKCPTTSQMIGWLRERYIRVYVKPYTDCNNMKRYKGIIHTVAERLIADSMSYKEVTLKAIDAALEYLTNNNKWR